MSTSSGYGLVASKWQNLVFNGDEQKFEQWEAKFLGYMHLKKLKQTILHAPIPVEVEVPAEGDQDARIETRLEDDTEKNEQAYSELIQFLDERSLALVMRDGRDNGREAFKILREHYASKTKPRIITLYTQLTTLKKEVSESVI